MHGKRELHCALPRASRHRVRDAFRRRVNPHARPRASSSTAVAVVRPCAHPISRKRRKMGLSYRAQVPRGMHSEASSIAASATRMAGEQGRLPLGERVFLCDCAVRGLVAGLQHLVRRCARPLARLDSPCIATRSPPRLTTSRSGTSPQKLVQTVCPLANSGFRLARRIV